MTIQTGQGPIRVTKTRTEVSSRGLPVLFKPTAINRKLSPVDMVANGTPRLRPVARAPFCSATYASIQATCPSSCAYKGSGCFAESGFTRHLMASLNKSSSKMTGRQVAEIEAAAIDLAFPKGMPSDGARGGRDLRLHVGGDVGGGRYGARALASAAKRWKERGGGSVWTYTHKWRQIPSESFGEISVLASVERPSELAVALDRGYAPAVTVDSFAGPKAFLMGGVKVVPCPAETRDTTCVECRLCLDRDLVGARVGIGFALHGPLVQHASKALNRKLRVIQ